MHELLIVVLRQGIFFEIIEESCESLERCKDIVSNLSSDAHRDEVKKLFG
jgi:hypothetical protein